MARQTVSNESAARGQTIRIETGREIEDKLPYEKPRESLHGRLKGDASDLSHSIRGNKVARPGDMENSG